MYFVVLEDFSLLKFQMHKHPNDSIWSMEISPILCLSRTDSLFTLQSQFSILKSNPVYLTDCLFLTDTDGLMLSFWRNVPSTYTHLTSMLIDGKLNKAFKNFPWWSSWLMAGWKNKSPFKTSHFKTLKIPFTKAENCQNLLKQTMCVWGRISF